MRRSDYNLVAIGLSQALNECRREPVSGVILAIDSMCEVLGRDNPNFNPLLMVQTIEMYTLLPVLERAGDKLDELKDKYSRVPAEITEF